MLEMSHVGSCLCNEVKFSINNEIKTVYHCHCSLCRKQTGTGANAATLVSQDKFEWLSGFELIHTYKKKQASHLHFVVNVDRLYLIW